eukprot:scaffold323463_cov17-Tisochrysis_lutea.AAC.2
MGELSSHTWELSSLTWARYSERAMAASSNEKGDPGAPTSAHTCANVLSSSSWCTRREIAAAR